MLPKNLSLSCIDILSKMLAYDESERWNASKLLKHKWFEEYEAIEVTNAS